MVKKEPVSVGMQIVLTILPFVWFYALYRIERLRIGLVLAIICIVTSIGTSIGLQILLPFPWGLVFSMVLYITIIPMYFVIKWSKKWNEQFIKPTNSE